MSNTKQNKGFAEILEECYRTLLGSRNIGQGLIKSLDKSFDEIAEVTSLKQYIKDIKADYSKDESDDIQEIGENSILSTRTDFENKALNKKLKDYKKPMLIIGWLAASKDQKVATDLVKINLTNFLLIYIHINNLIDQTTFQKELELLNSIICRSMQYFSTTFSDCNFFDLSELRVRMKNDPNNQKQIFTKYLESLNNINNEIYTSLQKKNKANTEIELMLNSTVFIMKLYLTAPKSKSNSTQISSSINEKLIDQIIYSNTFNRLILLVPYLNLDATILVRSMFVRISPYLYRDDAKILFWYLKSLKLQKLFEIVEKKSKKSNIYISKLGSLKQLYEIYMELFDYLIKENKHGQYSRIFLTVPLLILIGVKRIENNIDPSISRIPLIFMKFLFTAEVLKELRRKYLHLLDLVVVYICNQLKPLITEKGQALKCKNRKICLPGSAHKCLNTVLRETDLGTSNNIELYCSYYILSRYIEGVLKINFNPKNKKILRYTDASPDDSKDSSSSTDSSTDSGSVVDLGFLSEKKFETNKNEKIDEINAPQTGINANSKPILEKNTNTDSKSTSIEKSNIKSKFYPTDNKNLKSKSNSNKNKDVNSDNKNSSNNSNPMNKTNTNKKSNTEKNVNTNSKLSTNKNNSNSKPSSNKNSNSSAKSNTQNNEKTSNNNNSNSKQYSKNDGKSAKNTNSVKDADLSVNDIFDLSENPDEKNDSNQSHNNKLGVTKINNSSHESTIKTKKVSKNHENNTNTTCPYIYRQIIKLEDLGSSIKEIFDLLMEMYMDYNYQDFYLIFMEMYLLNLLLAVEPLYPAVYLAKVIYGFTDEQTSKLEEQFFLSQTQKFSYLSPYVCDYFLGEVEKERNSIFEGYKSYEETDKPEIEKRLNAILDKAMNDESTQNEEYMEMFLKTYILNEEIESPIEILKKYDTGIKNDADRESYLCNIIREDEPNNSEELNNKTVWKHQILCNMTAKFFYFKQCRYVTDYLSRNTEMNKLTLLQNINKFYSENTYVLSVCQLIGRLQIMALYNKNLQDSMLNSSINLLACQLVLEKYFFHNNNVYEDEMFRMLSSVLITFIQIAEIYIELKNKIKTRKDSADSSIYETPNSTRSSFSESDNKIKNNNTKTDIHSPTKNRKIFTKAVNNKENKTRNFIKGKIFKKKETKSAAHSKSGADMPVSEDKSNNISKPKLEKMNENKIKSESKTSETSIKSDKKIYKNAESNDRNGSTSQNPNDNSAELGKCCETCLYNLEDSLYSSESDKLDSETKKILSALNPTETQKIKAIKDIGTNFRVEFCNCCDFCDLKSIKFKLDRVVREFGAILYWFFRLEIQIARESTGYGGICISEFMALCLDLMELLIQIYSFDNGKDELDWKIMYIFASILPKIQMIGYFLKVSKRMDSILNFRKFKDQFRQPLVTIDKIKNIYKKAYILSKKYPCIARNERFREKTEKYFKQFYKRV